MSSKKAILLLSGGIDSTTLLAKLTSEGYQIIALSYNYNQKHSVELDFAKQNAKYYGVFSHEIINLNIDGFNRSALINPEIGLLSYKNEDNPVGQENSYVPFRNLVFISIAFSKAESLKIEEVFIGINKDDSANFWDCSNTFVEGMNKITSGFSRVKLNAPFVNLSKSEVINLAIRLKVKIADTISCYIPINGIECGVCLSCLRKKNAIANSLLTSCQSTHSIMKNLNSF
jgi:7-cyano-7-deazaguanine synthase